jgi:predicted ribosome quality control (RQC) complex YloA/Tae2 family protein
MDIKIDFTESAQENGNHFFQEGKRLELKVKRAEQAIEEMQKKLETINSRKVESKIHIVKLEEKKWYEKFHWFFTSNDLLVIGGRDAQQNELLNSKYFDDNDLFFHSNIFGASVTILKEGLNADQIDKEETAQFAASYSSAWEKQEGIVDVYSMHRDQVSKSTSKGSLGTGSFLLNGEREWYRGVELKLAAFKDDKFRVVPFKRFKQEEKQKGVIISEGRLQKSDAAKKISHYLEYDNIDMIMQQLPAGTFNIEEV